VNGTNVWVSESEDLTGSQTLTNGSTFTFPTKYPGMTWVIDTLRENEASYVKIKLDGAICARGQGPESEFIQLVPPSGSEDYTSFYHGPNYIVGDMWCQGECGNWIKQELGVQDRPVYIYHNTTHLWLYPNVTGVNFTDASKVQGPVAPGGLINDGYGGTWKIISISKGVVSLRGMNTLANGIMVNTSLSTSGNVWLGTLEEKNMGFKNQMSGEQQGLDLDGDGLKNSTLYFLILDDGTGYNKLAFSDSVEKWNFTNASRVISVSTANRNLRQVGITDKLTLLSIDPRARNVKFYDPSVMGDWPELGDVRIGDNVTIPVIIQSPDGTPVDANVSVTNIKLKTESGNSMIPTSLPAVLINGVGEIRVNVSALGKYAGRYEFGVRAVSGTLGEEKLNEWNWPRSAVRNFLVDASAGYGGVTSSFAPVSVTPYGGWMAGTMVRELRTRNETNYVQTGVMAFIQHGIDPSGCQFVKPASAGVNNTNRTYVIDDFNGQYFAFMTRANASIVWIKQGNCNFTGASSYTAGSPINITLGNEFYMLYVLNATMTDNGDFGAIGLLNFNSSMIKPIRMDNNQGNEAPKWNILSMNLSGTLYNVVFANDTMPYPQAGTWGAQDVAKVVWVDTDGNFANAQKKVIGDSVSGNKYLSRVGPGPWEGMLIADSSNLASIGITSKPGLDVKIRDGTPAYLGVLNESSIGLDLNMDGETGGVFYMVAFDDYEDGSQELTRIYLDDDLNISEPWWSNSTKEQQDIQQGKTILYYDFYGDEQGSMPEQDGSTPKGMWGGNLRFAPRNESLQWERSAEWNIKAYNGTNMVIEKNVWNLDQQKTISLTVKAFDFAQSPIIGANVSLVKISRFGGGPYRELNASAGDFTLIQTQNVTNSKGFAMLKIVPPGGGWDNADYIATLRVEYNGKSEISENWFRIGMQQGGGP